MPVLLDSPHTLPMRSDATVRKRKSKKEEVLELIQSGSINIVSSITMPNGNVVHIADNAYASKTPEELEAIKRNFYETCWHVLKNNHKE